MDQLIHKGLQTQLEGYWHVKALGFASRPHAFAHIYHDSVTGELTVVGHAFDPEWNCTASWKSSYVNLAQQKVVYFYEAYFPSSNTSFNGIAMIDLHEDNSGSLRGDGFFIDLNESPRMSTQRFEKLPGGVSLPNFALNEEASHRSSTYNPLSASTKNNMKLEPLAFFSYARSDDSHQDGQLSCVRKYLEGEVKGQTGQSFSIFQDRDIPTGAEWEEKIFATIRSTSFFIPVLTPSFFRSPHCRKESEAFLLREQELGRRDLILPIYYIDIPEIENGISQSTDLLAMALVSRQFVDLRRLRLKSLENFEIRAGLMQLAKQVRDLLKEELAGSAGQGSTC